MTVFGPGVGECIVLHLGEGDWIIVDSCTSPVGDEPAALGYLRSIGVDPDASVRMIVATHWHDDHIQGLATLLSECSNAQFVMSAALGTQQFFQLVLEVNAQNRLVKHDSSASEFAEILDVLESRTRGPYAVGPSVYADDGKRIFRGGHAGTAEVWALSPSAATVTNALTNLAGQLLTGGECKRFKRFTPNDLSVALLVRAGNYDLLLGADLENTAAPEFGWKAVLSSAVRPATQAAAFKVAHHGSANADHDEVWSTMLVKEPIAVVTPFAKLAEPLPRGTDVQRIKSRTSELYCTTWRPSKKPPRRRGVDGIVRGATKTRRAMNPKSGYLCFRVDLSNSPATPAIELFGCATRL
ncbi:MAG: MBL fold metallo-hydrolase [Pirellulaceae bacterium]|nr:MBL fold metallo-hydrolase [Pirellulaceae bacterium]